MSASLCNGDGVRRRRSVPRGYGRVVDRLDIDAVALQELVAGGFAEGGVADHDRDDVAWAGHHRQAGFGQAALYGRGMLLMTLALDLAVFEMTDAGERAGGECRRQ